MGCCHLGGHLLILIVDVEFWGQAFCLQLSILAWPSQGCCSGLISPLSGQNLTRKKELIRLRLEMNGYCWKKHWDIDKEFFFAHFKFLVIVWTKVSISRLEMMCTPSAHPPEEPSSCARLPERAVLLRAPRDRWEARQWGCAGPRTLDLGQAMQWCLFCLKEKLWSFCIWRKNVGNKRICRGCQTWGKDRIRKAVSVLPHPRLWASSLEVLR